MKLTRVRFRREEFGKRPGRGLMAWAPNPEDQFLKGAKPGDLPIRHPARYFLTINASAAKNLGLTLPPALLAEADRILP